ncbi:hypothetical protein GCM10011519_17150 [Marmoricola endophyticus]|uniref:Mycothiol acetyltransferase n=1 Tax=Marmoricola endophyticus TaxID=2040280 RepID=A0A917BIQ6_9ACTN|nr:mycothiol synthase [Marmoricola endophyticus]GGF43891.1 hypothetical protein GCM10011519_17150 [Marmoricola endophyticus]
MTESFDWNAPTGTAADVRRIAAAADAADGVTNLNEAACLHLKHRGLSGAQLELAADPRDGAGGGPAGFALRVGADLDVIVHPDARGTGVGTTLARAALEGVSTAVEAWSHSDHPAAGRIADRVGLARERELWVMQRPLDATLPAVDPPASYVVRAFRDGDEEGVLEVNSLAFAQHPEQGHLTLDDFRERQAEDWFDPAGLLLAVAADDESRVLGFHWTKVHDEGGDRFGEVYVVAVDPRSAGSGIGTVLTNAGLAHLRERGLDRVILYVEGDNTPAITVYDRAGFTQARVEAQYAGVPRL